MFGFDFTVSVRRLRRCSEKTREGIRTTYYLNTDIPPEPVQELRTGSRMERGREGVRGRREACGTVCVSDSWVSVCTVSEAAGLYLISAPWVCRAVRPFSRRHILCRGRQKLVSRRRRADRSRATTTPLLLIWTIQFPLKQTVHSKPFWPDHFAHLESRLLLVPINTPVIFSYAHAAGRTFRHGKWKPASALNRFRIQSVYCHLHTWNTFPMQLNNRNINRKVYRNVNWQAEHLQLSNKHRAEVRILLFIWQLPNGCGSWVRDILKKKMHAYRINIW